MQNSPALVQNGKHDENDQCLRLRISHDEEVEEECTVLAYRPEHREEPPEKP